MEEQRIAPPEFRSGGGVELFGADSSSSTAWLLKKGPRASFLCSLNLVIRYLIGLYILLCGDHRERRRFRGERESEGVYVEGDMGGLK